MDSSWETDDEGFVLFEEEGRPMGRVHQSSGGWTWRIGSRCGWGANLAQCQRFVETELGLTPRVVIDRMGAAAISPKG